MTVKKYSNGKWGYYFGYEGKRYRKQGFSTKRAATEAETKARTELSEGLQVESNITLMQYFKEWFETYKEPNVSPKTGYNYTTIINTLNDHSIGHTPIKNITRKQYQSFINNYAQNHTDESLRKINSRITAAMNDAVHEGLIRKNFTYKVAYKGKVAAKDESAKYITVEEYKRLKNEVKKNNYRSSLIIYIMIATGCRISGAMNLRYEYLNKKDNTIFIEETKTDTSTRTVSVSKEDMDHILNVINSKPLNLSGKVFDSITVNAVNKALKSYCKRLKIQPITSHALRHTHCSYLLANGVSIYYISKRLGHKNIKITLEVYSHLLEESYLKENDKAMQALNGL